MTEAERKALAFDIINTYGEEEGRRILQQLTAVERAGGEEFAQQGIEKLKQAIQQRAQGKPVQKAAESVTEVSDMLSGALGKDKNLVKGTAENLGGAMKTISGDEFADKISKLRALKKFGSKGLKALPIVGTLAGVGTALSSGDAAAALPILDQADPLGPQKGEEGYDIENPKQKEYEEEGPAKGSLDYWKQKLQELGR